MFMASKSMRVLDIVSGVLLIVVGIYCLCNQDIAVETAGLMVEQAGCCSVPVGCYWTVC